MRYGVRGSVEGDKTLRMISGGSGGGVLKISRLTPSTAYAIDVAAVNDAGTGEYSSPVTAMTAEGIEVVSILSSVYM